MKKRHIILELPEMDSELDSILSKESHQIQNISFSSTFVDGGIKHFALVVWHDYDYGDDMA